MSGIAATSAERFVHGTRSRYVKGCRCRACKDSNVAYYHVRQEAAKAAAAAIATDAGPAPQEWTARDGTKQTRMYKRACPGAGGAPCPTKSHLRKDSKGGVCGGCRMKLVWDGLVDAGPARDHIAALSKAGVGRNAVGDASGVRATTIADIGSGLKTKCRKSTADKILGVDVGARADGSNVPAGPTRRIIRKLLKRGFRRWEIAKKLGQHGPMPALQLTRRRVLASTQLRVRRLAKTIGDPAPKGTRWRPRFCDCIAPGAVRGRCEKCGGILRPDGMTQASIAGGPESTKAVHRAFGFDGGWGFDQRQSKVGKKREEAELKRLAKGKAR